MKITVNIKGEIVVLEMQQETVANNIIETLIGRVDTKIVEIEKNDKSHDLKQQIKEYAKRKEAVEEAKKIAYTEKINNAIIAIKGLRLRIKSLLDTANECLQYNIPLSPKYWDSSSYKDPKYFYTDGVAHRLGFVKNHKGGGIKYIGIEGGGWCDYNLQTDGICVEVCGGESLNVLLRFLKEFDGFEKRFYKYVDTVCKSI